MSADFHLHVFTEAFTPLHYAVANCNVMGSLFFVLDATPNHGVGVKEKLCRALGYEDVIDLYIAEEQTPGIWVGEVSWLKAALLEDYQKYVPSVVEKIYDIVGDHFPIINEKLITTIDECFDCENSTQYKVNDREPVIGFLRAHIGEMLFCASV